MFAALKKKLEARKLLHRVLGNTVWQLADKILRLGMGLVVAIWIARYLGPRDFGLLNYAIAFVSLFGSIADGGMQSIVVRDLVHRGAETSVIVSSALALRAIGSIAAILIAGWTVGMLRPGDHQAFLMVLIISLSLFPQAWDILDYEHQSRFESRPIVLIRAFSFCSFSIVKVCLILGHAGLPWFGWVIVGEASLSALVMRLLPAAKRALGGQARMKWNEIKYLLFTCWPSLIAGLSVMLYMRIDQVMLGQMLGDDAVGTFSAAVRISESWYFLPVAVLSSAAPALTATLLESDARFREKLLYVSRTLCWLAVAIALLLSLFSKQAIAFLYGAHYAAASSVLVVHAWAGVFASFGVASGPWYVNRGLLTLRMYQTLAGAGLNVVMNLYLIPKYGVVGAAFSTLASYALSGVALNAFSARTRPLFILQLRAFFLQ